MHLSKYNSMQIEASSVNGKGFARARLSSREFK